MPSSRPCAGRSTACAKPCGPLGVTRQEGRRVIVSISAVPLRHPGGRFAGAIGMNADLTALKSRETRLSEALRVERLHRSRSHLARCYSHSEFVPPPGHGR
jgi:hypothetical protein